MSTPSVITLNNGLAMPMVGYGVYQTEPAITERCVREAIDVGYRSIDTAQYYRNEAGVGRAVAACGLERSEIFVTTKLATSGRRAGARAIDESLRRLGMDYIDLLLIHWPQGDDAGTYRAMEDAYAAGKLRAIGLSNFYDAEFRTIADAADVVPAVNQVETHVFRQQGELRALMERYGTRTEAWSPLAQGRNGLFTSPLLSEIGRPFGKTAGQVALAYLVQLGIVVIPKTTHRARMVENLDVLDIPLTPDDLARISALEQGASLFGWL